MPQNCPPENDIAELAAGVLRGPRRAILEEHLDGCAQCRAMIAELVSHASAASQASGDSALPRSRLPQRGDSFGRFVILAWLGQGGMGAVYRARDEVLHREIALKVIDLEAPGARRVMREARTGAALEHPNVVATFDVGETDGAAFIAMELVKGVTLRERMASDAPMAERIAWLTAIASALAAAHARGIVHRDVKPENVMVRDDGIVKVLDFGLARWEASADLLTAKGAVIGTPAYMAPEQLEGAVADARSDQFAWGVVAYEVLCGARPWSVATREAVEAERPWDEEVPEGVRSVVERALAFAPEERFASMDQAAALTLAAGPVRTVALRPSPTGGWDLRPVFLIAASLILIAAFVPARVRAPQAPRPILTGPRHDAAAHDAYLEGLRALHEGSVRDARRAFARALAIEPGFAEASLRAAMLTEDADTKRRELLVAAQASRTALSRYDQNFLDALLPLAETPPRWDEADARLVRLSEVERKAELLVTLGVIRFLSHGDYEGAVRACSSAAELEPRNGYAGWCLADAHLFLGDAQAARDDVRRCVEASPAATSCMRLGVALAEGEGRCHEELDAATRLSLLEPQEPLWHQARANALIALGRNAEARKALEARWSLLPAAARSAEELMGRMNLATVEGDFIGAEEFARAWGRAIESDTDEYPHYLLLTLESLLLLETGRKDLVEARADAYLRAFRGWTPYDAMWRFSIAAYAFKHLVGGLSSSEFARARASWLQGEEERDAHRKLDRVYLWYPAYARGAATSEEAREALLALPTSLSVLSSRSLHDVNREEPLGRVLLLAGSPKEAVPPLRFAANSCAGLAFPIYWMRAQLELGEALEALGDTHGACDAYRAVVRRWRSARPRSESADAARRRLAAMRCD